MSTDVDAIRDAALRLPPRVRAELAASLLRSLDEDEVPGDDAPPTPEEAAELDARIDAHRGNPGAARAGRLTSEEIHHRLFPEGPPARRTVEEMDEGIAEAVKERLDRARR